MIIAITGGIGCGKTTALEYIKSKSYIVYDADKISHNILEQKEVKKEINDKISKEVFFNNDINMGIDRKKLGKIVFFDEKKLKILNGIVQARILQKMQEYIINTKKEEIVFFEVSVLFEMKLEKFFDKIIVIYSDKDTQIKRVRKRDNLETEDILNILDKQIDIEEKKRKADIVIENMGDIDKFKKNIDKILGEIYENK